MSVSDHEDHHNTEEASLDLDPEAGLRKASKCSQSDDALHESPSGLEHVESGPPAPDAADEKQPDGNPKDGGEIKRKITLQDQTNLLPTKELIVVFIGLAAALFCSLLDQTIVSTAIPTLGRIFGDASIDSWVGTAYLLTSTACQPIYGRLSDIFGRKVMLLSCMAIFLLGSILCAVSQSMIMLIICRAVSGIGGGGILTSVMIVTSDVVSLKERGKYQGILGSVVAVSNAIGPLLGGVFTEKASWRWCFYINIPLTSFAILVVFLVLPLKRVKGNYKVKLKKIDYLGCAIIFSAMTLILIPLSWGGTSYAWASVATLVPLIIGIVMLPSFFLVETKVAPLPLIPMHIFKNPTVAGALAGSFFTGIIFYVNLYYLPQFYQVVRQASPIHSGVLLLPLILTQTITSFTSGFLVSKTGNYHVNLWVGFAIWSIACGLLSTISPTISTAKLVGYQILSGIGSGQTLQTSLIAIQAAVQRKEMAVATGTRNFLRLLGGTVGLAACAAILNNTAKKDLKSILSQSTIQSIISDPTQISGGTLGLTATQQEAALLAYTNGIRNIYYFMIPCACLSFFITLFFVKQRTLVREDDEKRKAEGKAWVAGRKTKHQGATEQAAATEMQASTAPAQEAHAEAVEPALPPTERIER